MPSAETKAGRIQSIEQLLLEHPGGMTPAEIAREFNVHRSTIWRYSADLPPYIYEEDGRWCIDRQRYLLNVPLTLHEATVIHLACRLLTTCLDRFNPHAVSLLSKLSTALNKLAPHISHHLEQSATGMKKGLQWDDPAYLRTLELLTLAWAEGRRVHLWYYSQAQDEQTARPEIHEYEFSPYFIEPYAVGRGAYVIGWRDPPGALRTFRIERIARVEITRQTYAIPPDFDPLAVFRNAWGIWFTEGEPVEVVLKFSPDVARRVGETRWHHSEQSSLQQDGSLLWRVWVSEPQEMMPWIRGWGAKCEVIEPQSLRQKIVEESRHLCRLYKNEIYDE